MLLVFFFQAEDGIRDGTVTGVQTCALPICGCEIWTSPLTGARYPIHWRVVIPKLSMELEVKTPLESQELTGKTELAPNYWEGAIVLSGRRGPQSLSGVGCLEMTGYDRAVQFVK